MSITINGTLVESFTFSGGERQPKVNIKEISKTIDLVKNLSIKAQILNSDELIDLLLVLDTLKVYFPLNQKHLYMYYFPYARQDRRCQEGESYSMAWLARQLTSVDTLITADIHNLDRFRTFFLYSKHIDIPVSHILSKTDLSSYDVFVAPDEGAKNKVSNLADLYEKDFAFAKKQRDLSSGKIIDYQLYSECNLEGKNVLIVDDICDGGSTFINLAAKLKERKVGSMTLYVTHGIFSGGFLSLCASGIRKFITTDSFYGVYKRNIFDVIDVEVIKMEEVLK